jgi:ERCC4-type nuclease
MLIKIDCREIKLIQLLNGLIKDEDKEKIKMVSENLPLGDIILYDDAGQEKAIIERKSLADLAASIRDGRYKEQSFRLNQCTLHNHQIYYLIEGDLRFYKAYKGMPDKKALLSAMVSMSYFKGFSLFRTVTLEETAEWLLNFALKLEKEGLGGALPFYTQPSAAGPSANAAGANAVGTVEPSASAAGASAAGPSASAGEATSYAEVIGKRIKKDNITPENIGEIMLMQIPNVSCASAAAIMLKFQTIAALLTALQADANCLNTITTTNKNGQSKKLTKPCINAVYDFLVKRVIINVDI